MALSGGSGRFSGVGRAARGGAEDSYAGCRSRRCSCPASTTEVANVTADLDTRCGEVYASGDEVLPARQGEGDRAAELGGVGDGSASESVRASGFSASYEQFESLIGLLDGADAAGVSHAELEERLDRDGRVTVQSSGPAAGIPCWCSESCSHGSCAGGGDLRLWA
jgi:hypothetical protein